MMRRSHVTTDRASHSAAAILLPYIASLAMVALSTIAGSFIAPRWGTSAVDLLYLPTILAAGTLFGLWPALVAGLASALAFNFFFTPPFHTFRMDRPADIVTVVVLFLVATVTSKLAANVREQAELARSHASRNATIAGFAARLLSCTGKPQIASVACAELARIFDCNAIMVEGTPQPTILASDPPGMIITPSDIATAASVLETGESAGRGAKKPFPTDWQFHAVRTHEKIIAAVGLVRDDDRIALGEDQQELVSSLLDQIALALERARLEREASDFAALRERDRVRSALLSSIGRELRPPVETIEKAVRDFRRGGSDAKDAAATVGSEAMKLDRYISNLLELQLEADERPLEVRGVTIDLAQRRILKDGAEVHLTPKEYSVLAELAKHPGRVLTHAHLLRSVWGPAQENQTEYLRVVVRALRQKLEDSSAEPKLILNEPGVGYRLSA